MSIDNSRFIPCDQVLPNIVLYIDHEISSHDEVNLIEYHFGQCPSCRSTMEQETQSLNFVRNLLCAAMQEQAPQELCEKINTKIDNIYNQMLSANQTPSVTEFTYTQTTYTEFTQDGTTQIEITSEIRREFPLE